MLNARSGQFVDGLSRRTWPGGLYLSFTQIFINRRCGFSSLAYRPHDEALAAPAIACGEYTAHGGLMALLRRLVIASRVGFHTELLGNILNRA